MLSSVSSRIGFMLIALACAGLLGFGQYLQNAQWLDPCPLCMVQRLAFAGMGLFALLAAVHNPGKAGRWVYGCLVLLFVVLGALIAGRHIWMQGLPADMVPDCGPGLTYMLKNLPLRQTLENLLQGSGTCATVDWAFLGLSMPWWTMFWYIGLGLVTLALLLRRKA